MSENAELKTHGNASDLAAQVLGRPRPSASVEDAPVMQLDQVAYHYRRGRPVLRGVSASLGAGKVTALVGPNAAGKSTLMRLLLGALHPTQGKATLAGLEVGKLRPADRARWISYVPQRAGVRFGFSVRQVVAMGRFAAGDHAKHARAIASILDDAGLADVADRPYAQLSGGQQQRVLLARAQTQALGGGRVMLLDEPASHLDLRHAHATMLRLRERASEGLAVLVVVHDLNLALRYADDAWLLDRGRLVQAGPWHEVLTPEVLAPVYGVVLRQQPADEADPTGRPTLIVGPGANAATMPPRAIVAPPGSTQADARNTL
ncbi:MAG: ABC transporter ATP-binding protein [Phycisphaerales bacterium JB063]